MSTLAVICSSCGQIRLADTYARAQVVADQHHTVSRCYSHVSIRGTR